MALAAAAGIGVCAILFGLLPAASQPASVEAASLPPIPSGFPSTMQLGLSDSPGGAAAMKATTN